MEARASSSMWLIVVRSFPSPPAVPGESILLENLGRVQPQGSCAPPLPTSAEWDVGCHAKSC